MGRFTVKDNPLEPDVKSVNRMKALIDQSLAAAFYVSLVGPAILLFQISHSGFTSILILQLIACTALSISLYYRRVIPEPIMLAGLAAVILLPPALDLIKLGLLTPALIVMTIMPIIVSSVYGMKPALILMACMITLIAIPGALHTFGIIQITVNLQSFMKQPANWITYVVVYSVMVFWSVVVTAKLSGYWQASLRDLKTAEEEAARERELVAKLQRQQSIVQLSGGVAHDFNNILAAITANLELVKQLSADTNPKQTIEQALNDAMDATERGAGLTRNLLTFAKVAVLEPKELDINNVVTQSISWISRTIPANVEIETELADNLRMVYVDEASLSSALLNLIINSRDAMPDGGKILIQTQAINNVDKFNLRELNSGHYVQLTVTDSGTGITAEEQQRVFEPFYSTKGPSEGSGLGLAMVHGFMKQTGGAINLSSAPDSGTSFMLFFPAGGVKRTTPEIVIKKNLATKDVCLLIVDDEAAILNSLEKMMIASGYQVRTATNGEEAWKTLRDNSDINIVISDVIMPGKLQGTDLARKIQGKKHSIPVILMSGHTFAHRHDLNLPIISQLLSKPIRKADLINAIETALNSVQVTEPA